MNKKLIDTLTWEEITNKIMEESNLYSPKFKKWIESKKELKGTFFDSATWRMCYQVYKEINFTNDDFMEFIVGKEGHGKSKLARQKAAIVDPTFCKERIFKERRDLYAWFKKYNGNTKGKAIVIDEGNRFFNSREAMTKQNVVFLKFLSMCRQAQTYMVICVPNFKTIDSYAREHRIDALTRIITKHNGFRYYNEQGIRELVKAMKKGVDIKIAKVRKKYSFLGFWNSQEPELNDLTEEVYEKLKAEAWNEFLQECVGMEEGLKDPERRFASTREVSKITGVSKRNVINMCNDGRVKAQKFGSKWLIDKHELRNLVV